MSLLNEISSEDITPQGRPLPDGLWKVTVLNAAVKAARAGGGTYLWREYGNIFTTDGQKSVTLPDGSIFNVGNRKLFSRSTLDNANEDAVRIGNGQIKQEAVATGIVSKPGKGEKVAFTYADDMNAYTQTLIGKEVVVRTAQKVRTGPDKKPVLDDEGQPIVDAEIVQYVIPKAA